MITESKYFTGCEARNILYIFSNQIYTDESIRAALFRAVEDLVCISFINEVGVDKCRFDGFMTETKYMHCENSKKKSKCAFECHTCELSDICNSCRNACHAMHSVKRTKLTSPLKCKCDTKLCVIQPS